MPLSHRTTIALLATLLTTLLLPACSDTTGSDDTQQPPGPRPVLTDYPPAPSSPDFPEPTDDPALGRAADIADGSLTLKDDTCQPVEFRATNNSRTTTHHFYADVADTPARLVKLRYGIGSNLEGLHLRAHYDNMVRADTRQRFYTTVIRVESVHRSMRTSRDSDNQSACQTDQDWTPRQFRQRCGTGYIDYERMGGYILVSRKVDDITRLDHSQNGFTVDLDSTDNDQPSDPHPELTHTTRSNDFHVTAFGFDPPAADLFEDGQFDFADALTVLNRLGDAYRQALEDDKIFDPAYGTVLERSFQTYSTGALQDCGVSSYEAFRCYSDLQRDRIDSKHRRIELENMADRVNWKLDNRDRVDWNPPTNDPPWAREVESPYQRYQDFAQYLDLCLTSPTTQTTQSCQSSFDAPDASPTDTCQACTSPRVCSNQDDRCPSDLRDAFPFTRGCNLPDIRDTYRNLPPTPISPPTN